MSYDEFEFEKFDGDDYRGTVIDQTDDGAITCVEEPNGEEMTIYIDPDTAFGEKIEWMAGHHGEEPGEFLVEAVVDALDGDVNR